MCTRAGLLELTIRTLKEAVTTSASLKTHRHLNPSAEAAFIYGAQYRTVENVPSDSIQLNGESVPCSVCYVSTRTALLMIPGRYDCPDNWTREYYGHIMSESHSSRRSAFKCVDVLPESGDG